MNHQYNTIRTTLSISSTTSKAKTLTEAAQYIKMLMHVLHTSDRANANGNGSERLAESNATDPLETAEQLEEKYTLTDDFRAILPKEMQTLSIPALVEEMPCVMKLFALKPTMPTSDDSENDCNVAENGPSGSSCKPMEIEIDGFVDECNVQPMDVDEVIEQPAVDQTNVTRIQNPSSCLTNCENRLDMKHDNVKVVPSINELYVEEDVEMKLPSFASLQNSIRSIPSVNVEEDVEMSLPSTSIMKPIPTAVQEPEPMEVDCSMTTELERNLGEVCDEWLDWDLLDTGTFYNDQDRLIYMDTDSGDENDIEVPLEFTNL
ncbi:uncharacterized protein LOC125775046 [Anopheles funestus]|uniref:uncharacterized protein LOC125775046 n=1 Tax=Anopheles funestus TaxID=62324 RepID=UPI0020C740CF|nr:uncharacterized protein LOC125775046 [Anopheles funestus]